MVFDPGNRLHVGRPQRPIQLPQKFLALGTHLFRRGYEAFPRDAVHHLLRCDAVGLRHQHQIGPRLADFCQNLPAELPCPSLRRPHPPLLQIRFHASFVLVGKSKGFQLPFYLVVERFRYEKRPPQKNCSFTAALSFGFPRPRTCELAATLLKNQVYKRLIHFPVHHLGCHISSSRLYRIRTGGATSGAFGPSLATVTRTPASTPPPTDSQVITPSA